MKNLNTTGYNKTLLDWALLALRIFVGVGMLTRISKTNDATFWKIEFINFFGIGEKPLLILAVLQKFFVHLFVLMGLFTRFTVFH
jgi:uncharacterized membrane protein YphA (DoxX/SURF4 family)